MKSRQLHYLAQKSETRTPSWSQTWEGCSPASVWWPSLDPWCSDEQHGAAALWANHPQRQALGSGALQLVVSWIRQEGKLPDRPGEPKCVVRVAWERLTEAPVCEVFLRKNLSCITGEVGDMETEELRLKGNRCLSWWQPKNLLMDTGDEGSCHAEEGGFWAWLTQGSPETISK